MLKIYSKLVVFSIVFASIIAISSCQNSDADNTITIWHDKEDEVAETLEKAINEACPEIKLEMVHKEGLTDTLKLVGNNPNAAPDMYMFAHDKIGLFSEIGILSPITDFVSQESLSNFMDLTLDAATYKGTIYQLPIYFETLLFMYNKAKMTELDVPKTTEDLYNYMASTTTSRRYGFVEQHSTSYYSAGWIHGFGGHILDDEGKPGLNSEETIAALTYHKKFVNYMPSGTADYATVNTLFCEKKANSIIAGPWLVPVARENGIDLGFAEMPIVNDTNKYISPYAGIQGLHVLKVAAENATKKANITKILNALVNPQIGIDMAKVSGCAPANKLAYNDESITSDEMVMAMKSAAEKALPMPNRPEMDVMWTVVSKMLVEINLNNKDITESANSAQKEAEKLISMMG